MAAPEVDRLAASRAAVERRRERAEVKRLLKRGETSILDVLERADRLGVRDAVGAMRAEELVRSLPAVGPLKTEWLLDHLGIEPRAKIGFSHTARPLIQYFSGGLRPARTYPECSSPGCGNPAKAARGLCWTHYRRRP